VQRENPGRDPQERGLADTIASRQHQHLTFFQLQVHAAKHGMACQGDGDGVEAQRGHRAMALA
jgi:hypothetical protein